MRAGAGVVAGVRTRGKEGRGAETTAGVEAGAAAKARGAKGTASETANLVARRKRRKTTSGPGLDPDQSPRTRSI